MAFCNELGSNCDDKGIGCMSCSFSKKSTGCSFDGYCGDKGSACNSCSFFKYKKSNKRSKRKR